MTTPHATAVFRLDRFTVPGAAREEFLTRVRQTHALLRSQPGFVRDLLLETPAGNDTTTLVTLVEWQDGHALPAARAAVHAWQASQGFSPPDLLARLGIVADLGEYRAVEH